MEKVSKDKIDLETLAKEQRKAYYKKWHKDNPGKRKEYQNRYWMKKAKESIEKEKI